MKRITLIIFRVVSIPALVLGLFELYNAIGSILTPDLEAFDRFSYLPAALGVVGSTIAAAVVATIAAVASVWLFGRHGILVAAIYCSPIFRMLWPWNPIFHDFHWTALQWVIASYEFGILALFILWSVGRAARHMKRSNKLLQATCEDARA
jgi:hypothetical protein